MVFDIVVLKAFHELTFTYLMGYCEFFSSSHYLVSSWSQEVSPAHERIFFIKNGYDLTKNRIRKILGQLLNGATLYKPNLLFSCIP